MTNAILFLKRTALVCAGVFVGLLTVGIVAMLLISFLPQDWQRTVSPDTHGTISVDTPEVYTRERLVNDRFLQEAWLSRQLNNTDKLLASGKFDGVDVRRNSRASTALQAEMEARAGEKGASPESPSKSESPTKAVEPSGSSMTSNPIDVFHDAQAYREEIREELMRTQLDDRHDIEGNTLYRLNFDASVFPGSNTRNSVLIRVILEEGDNARLLNYMNLYADWNEQLQLLVDSAIEAQTDDLLRSSNPLPSLDRVTFQEFISNTLCKNMSNVAHGAGFPDPKIGHKDNCAELTETLGANDLRTFWSSISFYLGQYIRFFENRNSENYAQYVVDALSVRLADRRDGSALGLPEELRVSLCEMIGPFPRDTSIETFGSDICRSLNKSRAIDSGPDNETRNSQEQRKPSWYGIVKFANTHKECDPREMGKQNPEKAPTMADEQGDVRVFKVAMGENVLQLPCPPGIRQQETLLGALTLIAALRHVAAPDNTDRLKSLKLGVNNDPNDFVRGILCDIMAPGSQPDLGFCSGVPEASDDQRRYQKPWPPTITKDLVQRLVAQYVKAKLEGELKSHRAVLKISTFFDARIAGCELGTCTLLLNPIRNNKDGEEDNGEKDACRHLAGEGAKAESTENAKEYVAPYRCTVVDTLREILSINAKVFSYAVTPTDIVQRIESDDSTRLSLQAALQSTVQDGGLAFREAFSTLKDFDETSMMRHRSPLVIGFGKPFDQSRNPRPDPSTQLGWIVRPRLLPGDSEEHQVAQHYPLAAVVSVPSWWRSLKVWLIKEWVNDDYIEKEVDLSSIENCNDAESLKSLRNSRKCEIHYVEVPGSVKEVNEKLRYEVRKEPYIDWPMTTSRGDQLLEIGRKGRIILEGGRLWRSTVVTLGQQKAERIIVLPDMNGVIAEFDCVEPPPGETGHQRVKFQTAQQVTVWTSEGRTSTPLVIHLKPFVPRVIDSGRESTDQPCYLDDAHTASALNR